MARSCSGTLGSVSRSLDRLLDLRDQHSMSIVLNGGNLSTIAYYANLIAVTYLGHIVEIVMMHDLLDNPQH